MSLPRAVQSPGEASGEPLEPAGAARAAGSARRERRRRERHLQALRRDALVDVLLALALMTVTLMVTSGLGVVAILALPVGLLVMASYLRDRLARRGAARPSNSVRQAEPARSGR
jgi:hypothetical protein